MTRGRPPALDSDERALALALRELGYSIAAIGRCINHRRGLVGRPAAGASSLYRLLWWVRPEHPRARRWRPQKRCSDCGALYRTDECSRCTQLGRQT